MESLHSELRHHPHFTTLRWLIMWYNTGEKDFADPAFVSSEEMPQRRPCPDQIVGAAQGAFVGGLENSRTEPNDHRELPAARDGVTPISSACTNRLRISRGYTLPRVKHKGC